MAEPLQYWQSAYTVDAIEGKEDGKEQGKERKRRQGRMEKEGKRREAQKTAKNCNFLTKFSKVATPVSTLSLQSWPNLARKYGPMVYTSVPNFIMLSIYCYI